MGETASFLTDLSGKSITLSDTGNAFTAAVDFTTTGTGGDVTIDGGTATLDLGASTIGGFLAVTNGNTIDDSGAITVAETASFTTDLSGKAIGIDQAGSAYGGAISFSIVTMSSRTMA